MYIRNFGAYISRSSGANVATAPRDRGGSIAHGDNGYTGSFNSAGGGNNGGGGNRYRNDLARGNRWLNDGRYRSDVERGRGWRGSGRGFDGRGFNSQRGIGGSLGVPIPGGKNGDQLFLKDGVYYNLQRSSGNLLVSYVPPNVYSDWQNLGPAGFFGF
jgi:hypothetical protein